MEHRAKGKGELPEDGGLRSAKEAEAKEKNTNDR